MSKSASALRRALLISAGALLMSGAPFAAARNAYTPSGPAALALRVVDADSGEGLTARVRMSSASWLAAPRVSIVNGRSELRLEPGRYQLQVSHGPAYDIVRRELHLAAGERRELRVAVRREVAFAGYLGCDLHVHTSRSPDADSSLQEQTLRAAAEDLQVIGVSDHNRAIDANDRRALAGTAVLPGVEITTWQPEFGHFNAFPLVRAPRYKHTTPVELVQELRALQAGFIQINHPRLMEHIGFFRLHALHDPASIADALHLGFDGIEVWNGYDLARSEPRDRVLRDWFGLIARGEHVTATGGSDAHGSARNAIGYPRTYVSLPRAYSRNSAHVAGALKAGRAFVSNGPWLALEVAGRGPGETVAIAAGAARVRVRVTADAPHWMDLRRLELWVDGRKRFERSIDASSLHPRARWVVQLDATEAHSVVALVRGQEPMDALLPDAGVLPFAFTNPVWLARAP